MLRGWEDDGGGRQCFEVKDLSLAFGSKRRGKAGVQEHCRLLRRPGDLRFSQHRACKETSPEILSHTWPLILLLFKKISL